MLDSGLGSQDSSKPRFGGCLSFPELECWAVMLVSQEPSIGQLFQQTIVGQLVQLPRTQVLGRCFSFPGLKCWAVDLASQDSVNQCSSIVLAYQDS